MRPNEIVSTSNSRTDAVFEKLFTDHGVKLFIKRDDLIDTEISGNKWRKLKYNVKHCLAERFEGILTFGGAYSNHLVATAAACKKGGIHSVGIVRGDELNAESNDTLKRCVDYGMELHFVARDLYAQRNEKSYKNALSYQYPNHLVIPEGGANYYGMLGCQEILQEVREKIDIVIVAQGTTTTSIGICTTLSKDQKLLVVPVLKGFDSIGEMKRLMKKYAFESDYIEDALRKVEVLSDYHFGGYGKYNDELLGFIRDWYQTHSIKLDPVYTGKAMFGLYDVIRSGRLDNKNVLFIHTGGVQGSNSIMQKSGLNFYD